MKKTLLLLTMLISFVSCTYTRSINSSEIKNPPNKNFVKVYKELMLTRCAKKAKKKKAKKCETKSSWSTGSGLLIDIVPNRVVVLTAGHVCSSSFNFPKEDKEYIYSWKEEIAVLNHNKKFYDAKLLLADQLTSKSSDLCTLEIPGLANEKTIRKLKLSPRPPRVGENVYYMGAPMGIYHPPTVLIVKGVYNGHIDSHSASLTIPAAPGASGSVIMSYDHKVYGVLYAVHPGFRHATVSTSYNTTKSFLLKTRKLLNSQQD
jgi:hypothetical protein